MDGNAIQELLALSSRLQAKAKQLDRREIVVQKQEQTIIKAKQELERLAKSAAALQSLRQSSASSVIHVQTQTDQVEEASAAADVKQAQSSKDYKRMHGLIKQLRASQTTLRSQIEEQEETIAQLRQQLQAKDGLLTAVKRQKQSFSAVQQSQLAAKSKTDQQPVKKPSRSTQSQTNDSSYPWRALPAVLDTIDFMMLDLPADKSLEALRTVLPSLESISDVSLPLRFVCRVLASARGDLPSSAIRMTLSALTNQSVADGTPASFLKSLCLVQLQQRGLSQA